MHHPHADTEKRASADAFAARDNGARSEYAKLREDFEILRGEMRAGFRRFHRNLVVVIVMLAALMLKDIFLGG